MLDTKLWKLSSIPVLVCYGDRQLGVSASGSLHSHMMIFLLNIEPGCSTLERLDMIIQYTENSD